MKRYFGNHLVHDYPRNNNVGVDVYSNVYEPTLVDSVELVNFDDGSLSIQPDIAILKGVNSSSSPALVESLSMRMQIRQGSGKQNLKDEDILNVLKSRKCQDVTELASYKEAIKAQFGKDLTDYDMEKLYEKLQNESDESEDKSDES